MGSLGPFGAAAVITIYRNGEAIKSCAIEEEAVLGRSDGCVIRLDDRAVSRQHALFRVINGGVQVERKSQFGPLIVNGAECTRAILKEGDIVSIGPYLMQLSLNRNEPTKGQSVTVPLMAQAPGPEAGEAPPEPVKDAAGGDVQIGAQVPQATRLVGGIADGVSDVAEASELSPLAPPEPVKDAGSGTSAIELDASAESSLAIEGGGAEQGQAHSPDPFAVQSAVQAASQAASQAAAQVADEPGADPQAAPFTPPVLESMDFADSSAKTRQISSAKISARLVFKPGGANVDELEITKEEIFIGRGKNCDAVLNEKKASRRHALIKRSGMRFSIEDLNSSNGTYVNGAGIEEKELSSDDVIRIGEVEFTFKALSVDYLAGEKNFLSVPDADSEANVDSIPELHMPETPPQGVHAASLSEGQAYDGAQGANAFALTPQPVALHGTFQAGAFQAQQVGGTQGQASGISGIAGIAGIIGVGGVGTAAKGGKRTLLGWYRAQPKPRQIMVGLLAVMGVVYLLFDEEEDAKTKNPPKKQQAVVAPSGAAAKGASSHLSSHLSGDTAAGAAFEKLTLEQKRFVETQHALGFEHFKNKDYDKAIFEIGKIFNLVPDYKDARMIERYAQEGKRKLEAMEEENRRKEEEAQLKTKIADLVNEGRQRMGEKQYEQAKELFGQILGLDPENQEVHRWRKVIDDFEEAKKLEAQQKQVRVEINKRAWDIFSEGMGLKKKGRFFGAMSAFQRAIDVGASDKGVISKSRAMINQCGKAVRKRRDPLLAEAKKLEDAGELGKAFLAYKKTTRIDPYHQAAYQGMKRIRAILHDRAKAVYTEAVLAESYSDFAVAKKKFKEVIEIAPEDDIYHSRARSKLARYFGKDEVIQ